MNQFSLLGAFELLSRLQYLNYSVLLETVLIAQMWHGSQPLLGPKVLNALHLFILCLTHTGEISYLGISLSLDWNFIASLSNIHKEDFETFSSAKIYLRAMAS